MTGSNNSQHFETNFDSARIIPPEFYPMRSIHHFFDPIYFYFNYLCFMSFLAGLPNNQPTTKVSFNTDTYTDTHSIFQHRHAAVRRSKKINFIVGNNKALTNLPGWHFCHSPFETIISPGIMESQLSGLPQTPQYHIVITYGKHMEISGALNWVSMMLRGVSLSRASGRNSSLREIIGF